MNNMRLRKSWGNATLNYWSTSRSKIPRCFIWEDHWKAASYLMFHEMMHVTLTISQNSETKRAQQVFCVYMGTSEMCLHVREKGRSVIAHLCGGDSHEFICITICIWFETFRGNRLDRRRASPRACGCLSYAPEALAQTQTRARISCNSLKRRKQKE